MTWKEYWGMTKWEWFIEGFRNISSALDCYNTPDPYGYDDFWEALSWGWLNMESEYRMSQPGFDPYNLRGRDSYYTYVMSNK